MKRLLLTTVLAGLMLAVSPTDLSAQEETTTGSVNLGCLYNSETEAVGFSVQAMRKLKGGLLQLSAVGAFGEAANTAAIETGLFLLEGGPIEAAIIQGISESWEGTTAYTAGYTGLFATFKTPWNWPGYDKALRFFAKGNRYYPLDDGGAQEAAYEFVFGVTL